MKKQKNFTRQLRNVKKNAEQKIIQMKENALRDIRNSAIKISIESVESLIKNSIDKNKLENLYNRSLEQTRTVLKQTKV